MSPSLPRSDGLAVQSLQALAPSSGRSAAVHGGRHRHDLGPRGGVRRLGAFFPRVSADLWVGAIDGVSFRDTVLRACAIDLQLSNLHWAPRAQCPSPQKSPTAESSPRPTVQIPGHVHRESLRPLRWHTACWMGLLEPHAGLVSQRRYRVTGSAPMKRPHSVNESHPPY